MHRAVSVVVVPYYRLVLALFLFDLSFLCYSITIVIYFYSYFH